MHDTFHCVREVRGRFHTRFVAPSTCKTAALASYRWHRGSLRLLGDSTVGFVNQQEAAEEKQNDPSNCGMVCKRDVPENVAERYQYGAGLFKTTECHTSTSHPRHDAT
eukprot:scaffold2549_cov333-Pavlova_lutheri.AAC.10